MPPIAGAIVGAAASSFVGGLFAAGSVIGGIVSSVVGGVVSNLVTSALTPKPPKVDPRAITINETGSLSPIPIVYGLNRIAPSRVYIGTSDDNNGSAGDEEYLHCVYTISNNRLESIRKIFFDGREVGQFNGPFTEQGYIKNFPFASFLPLNDAVGDGSNIHGGQFSEFTINGSYKNFVKEEYNITLTSDQIEIIAYDGSDFGIADENLITGAKDQTVNEDFRGSGWLGKPMNSVSYIYVKLRYNEKLFSQGIPTLQVECWGAATNYEFTDESGNTIFDNWSTIAPGDDTGNAERNGAAQIADYLISGYGKNLDPSLLDYESFEDVAQILYDNGIVSDGFLDTNDTIFNNLKTLLDNNLCSLVKTNGIYKLKYIAPEDTIFTGSTFEFTDDNILESLNVNFGGNKSYDIARVSFYNDDLDFLPDTAVVYRNGVDPTVFDFDKARKESIIDISLPFTKDRNDAIYIASVLMEMSQFDLTVSLKSTIEALQLEPLDPVYLSNTEAGWDQKQFLVQEIEMNPDGTCQVILTEYPDIYPLTVGQEISSFTNLPLPDVTLTFIEQVSSTSNLSTYTLNSTFSANPTDRLVVAFHARGSGAFSPDSISVAGTGMDIDYSYNIFGSGVVAGLASISGLDLSSGSHSFVLEFPTTLNSCHIGVYKIEVANNLDPVELRTFHWSGVSNWPTTRDFTITDIPSNSAVIYAYTGQGNRSVEITNDDGFTITENYEQSFESNNVRIAGANKVINETAYSYSDHTLTWSGNIDTTESGIVVGVYK